MCDCDLREVLQVVWRVATSVASCDKCCELRQVSRVATSVARWVEDS